MISFHAVLELGFVRQEIFGKYRVLACTVSVHICIYNQLVLVFLVPVELHLFLKQNLNINP